MKVDSLRRMSGAWTETAQHAKFMRIAVKAEFDCSLVTPAVKKKVIKGLRTGVLDSTGGLASIVFKTLSDAFGLKYVCASYTGQGMYTNFRTEAFYQACVAMYNLTTTYNLNGHRQINDFNGRLNCWTWMAKDEMTRNIYEETIGFEDKKIREKAIDFLSTGGTLTQTWIDRQPK